MLARWIAVTGAPSLRILTEICSIPEGLATSKVWKILSSDFKSKLCRTKS